KDRVLELVVSLRQLRGDEPALTRLAQTVQPLALLALGSLFLLAQRTKLVAAEQVGVAGDDRRLLGDFLLTDADGSPLFRPLVQVPLELFLELRGAANRSGRHREDSIGPRARNAAPAELSRRRVSSLPRSSMLSKSPGETFEPVTATRIGSNALRGESSSRSARPRRAASISGAAKGSTRSSSSCAAVTIGALPLRSEGSGLTSRKRKPAKSGN